MKAATQPKVDLDVTRERLERVGLGRAAEQLDGLVSEAVQGNISPHRFLDRLLEEEQRFREERRIRTSLILSGLPTGQTLANFDFSFQPSLERSRIETLATCQCVDFHNLGTPSARLFQNLSPPAPVVISVCDTA